MLNDSRVDGYDRFLDAAQVKPEGITEGFAVLREDLHGIAGHRTRICEGTPA
jgi:hypothetical protein